MNAERESNGVKPTSQEKPVYITMRELMRMMQLAGVGSLVPADVGRLVAEVLRLRAKCRAQQVEIRALRIERDALAGLVVAYAPKREQG